MAVRDNIGKVGSVLGSIIRQSDLIYGLTQYGLGEIKGTQTPSVADNVDGEKPNTDFIWGIHRWGTTSYKIGK